jgi:hypothetical protein
MRAGRYVTILRSNSWSRSESDCTRHFCSGRGTVRSAYQQRTEFPPWLVLFTIFQECTTSTLSIVCFIGEPSCEKNINVFAGGHVGFDKVLWEARKVTDSNGPAVQFTYHSHDGEQGICSHVYMFAEL